MGNAIGCGCTPTSDKGLTKINMDRSCTDIPWLLLFIIFWGGSIAIIGTAAGRGGDVSKVLHGTDYRGYICGVNAEVKDSPFVAWPYITGAPDATICMKSCADTLTDKRFVFPFNYASTTYLSYCIPTILASVANTTAQQNPIFASASNSASRAFGDLFTCWWVIAIGAGIAFVISFLYLKLVEKAAGILVWASLFLILLGGLFICLICLIKANEAKASADAERMKLMQGLGIACAVCTFLYFCVIVFMRDRITLAIEVTKEASGALQDLPSAVFFPLIPFCFLVCYFVYWIYVALTIYSVQVETIKPNDVLFGPFPPLASKPDDWPTFDIISNGTATGKVGYKTFVFDTSMQNTFVYHFFHLLWNIEFFTFLTFLTICGAVSQWYFTATKNGAKPRGDAEGELPDSAIRQSFFRACRYHLGSICFASLIIAIIQFIRAAILYAERKAKEANMNETLRCLIFGCLSCFMKCIECCMRQINKNGMVMVAIYGVPFCTGSCNAFVLAWANVARVAFVSMVGSFLLGIGKVLICVLTTGLCGLILFNSFFTDKLSSPSLPLVVIFLLSYCVGSVFMEIYETCIDTVFMCFLVDEDVNKATGNYLAGPGLRKMIDDNTEKPEASLSPAPASK